MAETKSSVARRNRPFGLESWGPFRDLIEDVFGDRAKDTTGVSSPPVDITEADDKYVVTAEIPGVKKEDLKVELEEGVLTIAGEKRSEREETGEKGRWLERTYGAFSRSFTLPSDADTEKIDANFADGVLRLEIDKRPEAKPKAIAVK